MHGLYAFRRYNYNAAPYTSQLGRHQTSSEKTGTFLETQWSTKAISVTNALHRRIKLSCLSVFHDVRKQGVALTERNTTGPPSRAAPGELRCICKCYSYQFSYGNFARRWHILKIPSRQTQHYICNKVIVKCPATSESRCIVTLWCLVSTPSRLLFFDINISQGSGATPLISGARNLLLSLPVDEFWKSVSKWQSWRQKHSGNFSGHGVV